MSGPSGTGMVTFMATTDREVHMSLPVGERRRLRRMERSLARSDSHLVSLYSIFTRLTRFEAMPIGELLKPRAVRRNARRMHYGPFRKIVA
jgi:hypothetical protein